MVTNYEKAQFIASELGDLSDRDRDKIKNTKEKLSRRFNDLNIDLFHYDMMLESKASEFIPSIEVEQDTNKSTMILLMREQMSRSILTLELNGERVPPSYALKKLDEKIREFETDANERDRELYERILINTLGDNIRRKIHYVQRWEKEMNKFMEHENLIKFRILWVPKSGDTEEELSTKELVEVLKRDSQWVDLEEISKHFRSKIKAAKRQHENQKDSILNLQQIMREVLDYRKWYDFEIYFTKKGDKEQRLTRKTYGTLSGGQRVLAMITPVLAAVYAKYSEAREDCPRLFTLDEAFSRVDDENINIMFEYIYKLNFNYILNSQSLWGCFESVPSLDIYELVRPDNRPLVSVASYYWNGKERVRRDRDNLEETYHVVTT